MRVLLQYLLPLLLPTVLYIIYMMWARRRAVAGGEAVPAWSEGPVFWFALAGLLLVLASLIALFAFESDHGMGKIYQPPKLEDGKVVPGQFAPPGSAGG